MQDGTCEGHLSADPIQRRVGWPSTGPLRLTLRKPPARVIPQKLRAQRQQLRQLRLVLRRLGERLLLDVRQERLTPRQPRSEGVHRRVQPATVALRAVRLDHLQHERQEAELLVLRGVRLAVRLRLHRLVVRGVAAVPLFGLEHVVIVVEDKHRVWQGEGGYGWGWKRGRRGGGKVGEAKRGKGRENTEGRRGVGRAGRGG
mmetsp:Transcript_2136/g.3753  ORF Transcript_2136/g.3753 Transcript_2136/m.3753 type:complete len:201 (-) Transcript_2136:61-663(-)